MNLKHMAEQGMFKLDPPSNIPVILEIHQMLPMPDGTAIQVDIKGLDDGRVFVRTTDPKEENCWFNARGAAYSIVSRNLETHGKKPV